ncbi:redox-regulated ATPase YchF [Thermogemmatispora sp.]|uniref:redox-regulated ATPase YchF n=1 Tax=Thermogemmatispora sp. TaxID=1968838 RepID=UPI0035E45C3C
MALRIGIVGLPQSGKTSLFNALTGAQAPISGYATRTVQANTAVVQVPDPRLKPLAEIFKPKKVTYATVEFVDVAGMGQQDEEARKGGLSAEFLGHIRNADALAIVLRTFVNENVPHPLGSIDPLRDLEQLDSELALTDLATVERRSERTAKAAKSGEKKYQQELALLARLQEALSSGVPVRRLELNAQEEALVKELFLLTMKPRMYVLNVSEDVLAEAATLLEHIHQGQGSAPSPETLNGELRGVAAVAQRASAEEAETVAVSARLEAELSELAPEEAAEYLASLGLPKLGAERVIQVGYRLLNLITFLTVGEDEVRAWTVTKGAKAPEAAGKIHSDIERGFIRAEITHFDDFMACGGSFAAAARKGLQRLEGKDYVMQDGDIAHFRFNVGR